MDTQDQEALVIIQPCKYSITYLKKHLKNYAKQGNRNVEQVEGSGRWLRWKALVEPAWCSLYEPGPLMHIHHTHNSNKQN